MQIILNEVTETIHKPSRDGNKHPAACGALRHVSNDHIQALTVESLSSHQGSNRCGRCFEDAGGY